MLCDMGISRASGPPAERLLATAAALFGREGIRAVGIDRIVAEADVARASLYQAFGSKDGLIAAYLDRQDELDRQRWERAAARQHDDAVSKVLLMFDLAAASARKNRYPGCLYLNAAAEFPDPKHPVAASIARHRAGIAERVTGLLARAGVSDPEPTAAELQVLYDGALAGSKMARSVEPVHIAKDMARGIVEQRRR
jgi:AcrR family transcriptional regulator